MAVKEDKGTVHRQKKGSCFIRQLPFHVVTSSIETAREERYPIPFPSFLRYGGL